MPAPRPKPRIPVLDAEGRPFGDLDYRAAEHVEVIFGGRDIIRIANRYFDLGDPSAPVVRLKSRGDGVFLGQDVTTIDGVDLGTVVEVVHDAAGQLEVLVLRSRTGGPPLAVPRAFVREVTHHIILEPSDMEVWDEQPALAKDARVRAALERVRAGA